MAALKNASAQKVGHLWSGPGIAGLPPAFPDACLKGPWKLGSLLRLE